MEILALDEEEQDYAFTNGSDPVEVGAYTLTSEVFVQGVLTPLLATPPPLDEDIAHRCAQFLERLLGSGRASIREMVSIRVIDHLLGYPGNWEIFRKYAGEYLLCEVRDRRRYYKSPFWEGLTVWSGLSVR
ncbi:hypothetical protein [Streptomyces radiopugnans]|uniref:hypothetical protein n=1 Tax=Streptomyces radiopugnans TaxID=403935 RepID=UPI001160C5F1|nr:hypothetical protein [Streptomyces radiopugnans]